MISKEILKSLHQVIPAGQRSDFVNKTLEEALIDYGRRRASEEIDNLSKKWGSKISTEEFLRTRHEGLL